MSTRFIIYLVLLFAVFVVGLLNFKKLSSPYKLLTVFILITFISESTTRYFAFKYANSSPIYPIYVSIQYFCITAFYSFYLKTGRTLIAWSWLAFVFLAILNIVYFQGIWEFASNIVLVSSIVYVACALFLFKKMLFEIEEKSILKQELFWYNTSSLLLFIFTFFCWSFLNIMVKSGMASTLYNIIYYLVIQNYITTGIVIYLNSKNNQQKINAG